MRKEKRGKEPPQKVKSKNAKGKIRPITVPVQRNLQKAKPLAIARGLRFSIFYSSRFSS
jgi:hypothetical protein